MNISFNPQAKSTPSTRTEANATIAYSQPSTSLFTSSSSSSSTSSSSGSSFSCMA